MKKYDERETIFSRVSLQKGTKEYNDFYKEHSGYKYKDDKVRRPFQRENIKESDRFKELFLPLTLDNKKIINSMFQTARSKPVNPQRVAVEKSFTNNIKEIVKYFGATDVGIAKMTDYSYYLYQGGVSETVGLDTYNQKVVPRYRTAIVFTVKMDIAQINRGPHFEELLATEHAYWRVAEIGARLEMYLKELGYKSESQNGEYYLVPMVPLAYDAGLGQIGMSNHLVTKEYGDNVRLGAVLTTLELEYDQPVDFGLHEFCRKCALCLQNCPSKSITHLERLVNGRTFYKFEDTSCYDLWLHTGTDCGICIQSCPFSQGLDQTLVDQMKDNPKVMDQILDEHNRIHGRREYTKRPLNIVKIGESK